MIRFSQIKSAVILVATLSFCFAASAYGSEIAGKLDPDEVSKSRQTPYGLYLEPKDAFLAISNDPSIVLIDVRDPVEISFVGHPEPMDGNIPLRTVTRRFDAKGGRYEMAENAGFVNEVDKLMERLGYNKDHRIFVTCRSGPRSAVAARMLHNAGYKEVWNLVEGFEGSIDPKTGARSINGWRNAGLPWRYKIKPWSEWRS